MLSCIEHALCSPTLIDGRDRDFKARKAVSDRSVSIAATLSRMDLDSLTTAGIFGTGHADCGCQDGCTLWLTTVAQQLQAHGVQVLFSFIIILHDLILFSPAGLLHRFVFCFRQALRQRDLQLSPCVNGPV